MPNTTKHELGERGTPLWAFKRVKEDLIPSLFKDLKNAENDGLEEEQCELIKNILRILVRESVIASPGSNSDSSITEIWEIFEELRETYSGWNDEAETREEREAQLREMKQLRKRVKEIARNAYVEINATINKSSMVSVYQASEQATTTYPQTFVYLSEAVERFQKANSRA
jgi:hypothetical protein